MPSAKLKVIFGTLRARLTIWNSAVVLLLVVTTLVGVREGLRQLLAERNYEFLQEEMDEIEDEFRDRSVAQTDEIHRDLNYKATDHRRRKLFIQVFDPNGANIWSSEQTPETPWVAALLGASTDVIQIDDHLLLQRPIASRSIVVRIGISNDRAANDLFLFTRWMLVVGGIGVLIIPIVGFLLAGRATRPLSQIIDTAARLHPAQLNERLPVRGTHDELDRVSQTINGLLDRIARYLQRSREFNAHAAHELRTPLAAIQSSVEVTLLVDRTVEEYKEELLDLLEEFDRLRLLVNQLLLLAEGDAGRLGQGREPVRLDELVRRAIEMFQAVAESEGIRLAVGTFDALALAGDATALRQVVNNLLDNAVKFTPSGGSITVDLTAEAHECVLRVADTGAGIASADLPHIFEPFFRSEKLQLSERSHRGTGLGLSICRAIVEAHDGTIGAESAPGRGATFTVRLSNQQSAKSI
ncbi:MAG TPA: ATP-binding protein [Gemmataceae bacterium]|jgi:heavy metal sensor kinase